MIQKIKKIILDDRIPKIGDYNFEEFLDPKKVYFPITTNRAAKGELYVKEGEYVYLGQVIGLRDGGFFQQNIHSTVSGKFVGVEKKFFRDGKKVEFAVVENDFKENYSPTVTDLTDEEIAKLSVEELIKRVEDNSVVGLGGGAFPTSVKLKIDKNIDTVILNGVECEPYLVSDYILMLKYAKEIVAGLALSLKIYDAKNGYISVKNKNKELIDALIEAVNASNIRNITIKGVKDYYPQGYEKDVIYSTIGKKIAVSEMPANYGIMVINSTTAKAVYDAVRYNLPILTREFLVSGLCINQPKIMEVKIGTHVPEIIEKAGGYNNEYHERVLIIGGPMMGKSLALDDVVVTKAVSTILVMPKLSEPEKPCVRCGTCNYSCPSKLTPVLISEAVKAKNSEAVAKLNLQDCILCGLCSYVCTSKIPLTDIMSKGKKML